MIQVDLSLEEFAERPPVIQERYREKERQLATMDRNDIREKVRQLQDKFRGVETRPYPAIPVWDKENGVLIINRMYKNSAGGIQTETFSLPLREIITEQVAGGIGAFAEGFAKGAEIDQESEE